MPKIVRRGGSKVGKVRPGPGSVIDRIKPLSTDDHGINMNIYGRSGTGKTTLWSTFPKQILAIICSGGSRPGELKSIDTAANRKVIDEVVLENSAEITEIVEYVKNTPKIQTVVLDHATGLQDLVLKEILGLDKVPEQLSWGLATQQQYGQVALQTKERLRELLNLEQNVVIVAQEREFNIDSENQLLMPYVGSGLTPSVTGWLNAATDYIVQTFIRRQMVVQEVKIGGKIKRTTKPGTGVEFCLRTAPDPVYTTKFRVPKGRPLPEVIVDPTYDKLIKVIKD